MFTLKAQIDGTDPVYIQAVEREDAIGHFFTWYAGILLTYQWMEGIKKPDISIIKGEIEKFDMHIPYHRRRCRSGST